MEFIENEQVGHVVQEKNTTHLNDLKRTLSLRQRHGDMK